MSALAFSMQQPTPSSTQLHPHGDALLFGNDSQLQNSRALLLESAGFRCNAVSGTADPVQWQDRAFILAVLCHTLDSAQAALLADRIRAAMPFTPILRLSRPGRVETGEFDKVLVSPLPEEFVKVAQRVGMMAMQRLVRHFAQDWPERTSEITIVQPRRMPAAGR